jgi:hypothetical protein
MTDGDIDVLDIDALAVLIRAAANAYEQQRYRDAMIAKGTEAIAVIREGAWLCDRDVALIASQVVREVGRQHREEAEAALVEALHCLDERTRPRTIEAAKQLGTELPRQVGKIMPTLMDPRGAHHVIADHYLGAEVPTGDIYMSECGWVLWGSWVRENLHHLDDPGQQLCGHCKVAIGRGK